MDSLTAEDAPTPLYSWFDFQVDIREIIRQIQESGVTITGVFAIPKGGLPLGVALAHAFCVPLDVGYVPLPSTPTSVLAVDDSTITGGSLTPFAHRGMPCAVLVKHPNAPAIHPFFFGREASDSPLFPWEAEAPNVSHSIEAIVVGDE